MLVISLFLLFCGVLGLTKRSENSIIHKYTKTGTLKPNTRNSIVCILSCIIGVFLAHQTLIALLIIGGVEPNPGPSSQLTQDEDQFYECTPSYPTSHCSSLCGIKHNCEFPGCHEEIFAACHCDMCNGYGPLLCFKHFENDQCPLSTSSNSNTESLCENEVICSTCFKIYSIDSIRLLPLVFQQVKKVSGKFYYMCESCANRKDQCPVLLSSGSLADLSHCETQSLVTCGENHPLTTCTDVKRKCEKDTLCTIHEVPNQVKSCVQSCRIIIHKRHKHVRLSRIVSPHQISVGTLVVSKQRCIPLMSIQLRPPPTHILKKWLTPAFSPRTSAAIHGDIQAREFSEPISAEVFKKWNVSAAPFFPKFPNFKHKIGPSPILSYPINRTSSNWSQTKKQI